MLKLLPKQIKRILQNQKTQKLAAANKKAHEALQQVNDLNKKLEDTQKRLKGLTDAFHKLKEAPRRTYSTKPAMTSVAIETENLEPQKPITTSVETNTLPTTSYRQKNSKYTGPSASAIALAAAAAPTTLGQVHISFTFPSEISELGKDAPTLELPESILDRLNLLGKVQKPTNTAEDIVPNSLETNVVRPTISLTPMSSASAEVTARATLLEEIRNNKKKIKNLENAINLQTTPVKDSSLTTVLKKVFESHNMINQEPDSESDSEISDWD